MTLIELINKRRELVRIQDENNISDGIIRLLTDLYASSGHFIYELLQNAEDMNATCARFILKNNMLIFEHNGTKRNFTLEDIDAITNIGHNLQKLHDPTSIGKFGVGFKSVYAYTNTPEIHSGKYHFVIKNYFIPHIYDVPIINTVDQDGIEWTKFILPFDNSNKKPEIACAEIEKALKEIDDTSILFLRSIDTIEYSICEKNNGYAKKAVTNNNVSIECKSDNNIYKSNWLRFHKLIEINDENNISKLLNIGIAYSLRIKQNRISIQPVTGGGKTFIYFPAENEHSGLKFHINAPFASTVGRDVVRECKENDLIFKEISKLAAESIKQIKELGYLTNDFISVLPTDDDILKGNYSFLKDYMISMFYNHEYIPLTHGRFTTAKKAIICNDRLLTKVLSDKLLSMILGKDTNVLTASKNSVVSFYRSLSIEMFSTDDFKVSLINNSLWFEDLLSSQSDEWIKDFYRLLASMILPKEYQRRSLYNSIMENISRNYNNINKDDFYKCIMGMRIIRCNNNSMAKPSEVFLSGMINSRDVLYVKSDLYKENNEKDSIIFDLLHIGLKIEYLTERRLIETKLRQSSSEEFDADKHIQDILDYMHYAKSNDDYKIFENYRFILGKNKELYFLEPQYIVLGKSDGFSIGSIVCKALQNDANNNAYLYYYLWQRTPPTYGVLWDEYKNLLSDKDYEDFIKFIVKLGAVSEIKIIQSKAENNPQFHQMLDSEARHTGYGINKDYTINNLEALLQKNSWEVNITIWNTLIKNLKELPKYMEATYSPNHTATSKKCDSSLVYYLKNIKWIPDRYRKYHTPDKISVNNIHPEFKYVYNDIYNNAFFKRLGLKMDISDFEKEKRYKRIKNEAEEMGYVLIKKEEYARIKKYLKW